MTMSGLTMSGLSDRLTSVEEIVAKLAEDFYGTADTPITKAEVEKVAVAPDAILELKDARIMELEGTVLRLAEERRGLEAAVENLTSELHDAITERDDQTREAEYWHRQFNETEEALDDIRGKLAGLI